MRIAMRLAEFWLARECKNLRWYRRAVGGVWIDKTWWSESGHEWFRVDGMPDLDVSSYVSEEWP